MPACAVADRMERLRELIAQKNRTFRQGFIGRTLPAVTLRDERAALSDNFLDIELDCEVAANQNVLVTVTGLTKTGVTGKLEEVFR